MSCRLTIVDGIFIAVVNHSPPQQQYQSDQFAQRTRRVQWLAHWPLNLENARLNAVGLQLLKDTGLTSSHGPVDSSERSILQPGHCDQTLELKVTSFSQQLPQKEPKKLFTHKEKFLKWHKKLTITWVTKSSPIRSH